MANDINKETSVHFERLMKNVNTSVKIFSKNKDNFNKMKKFVFESSMTEDDKQKLIKLKRPTLEFNILKPHVSRLCGEFSIINPQFKIRTLNPSLVSNKTCDVVSSIIRNIISDSQVDNLDNEIFKDQLGGGFAVWDVSTEYVSERSFEQKIVIGRPDDPALCGFDPLARKPHKGDGRYCYKLVPMTEEDFKEQYPDADIGNINSTIHNSGIEWKFTDKEGNKYINICEYYEFEGKRVRLHLMGSEPSLGIEDNTVLTDAQLKLLESQISPASPIVALPIKESETRYDKSVIRYRFVGNSFIENRKKTDFAYLPLIFIDGDSFTVNREQVTRAYVQDAVGAQRAKNITGNMYIGEIQDIRRTRMSIAQQALPDKQEFLDAYLNPQEYYGALVYNGFTAEGQPIPGPQIQPSAPIPPELGATFNGMDATVQGILGSYQAQQGNLPINIAEETLSAGIGQSNNASKPYIMNYKASFAQLVKIIIDLIPKLYVTPKTMPVVDASGNRSYMLINDPNDKETHMTYEPNVLNLEITLGVSFEMQKKEALKTMTAMQGTNPGLSQILSGKGLPILLGNLDIKDGDKLQILAEEQIEQMESAQEEAKRNPPPPPPELLIKQKELELKQQEIQAAHQQKMTQIEAEREKQERQEVQSAMDFQIKYAQLMLEYEKAGAELALAQQNNEKDLADQLLRRRDQALKQMEIMLRTTSEMARHHDKINFKPTGAINA